MKKLILSILIILFIAVSVNSVFAANETLSLVDLDVNVGGEHDTNLENDIKIDKNAKPGDDVEFSVKLENSFESEDVEFEIESIKIEITIENIDDGADIEAETEKFSISAGDEKTKTLTLTIPEIVKRGVYDVIIEVNGKNAENNTRYNILWNLQIEVEKRRHDVIIAEYEFIPSFLDCGETQIILSTKLRNYGERDEDEITLEIRNSDLNINEKFTGIRLGKDYDKDAVYEKDIYLSIEKQFATPGNYTTTINVYFDNDNLDDQKKIDLEIKVCEEEVEEESEEVVENQTTEVVVEETSDIEVSNEIPTVTIESKTKSPYFIPIIGLFIIIGVIMIISLVIFLKKE